MYEHDVIIALVIYCVVQSILINSQKKLIEKQSVLIKGLKEILNE